MSKIKKNGESPAVGSGSGDGSQTTAKKRPQPKQVIDPFTSEWRDETKAEKFVRLAEQRVTNALKRLRQIKMLGNRNQYSYGEQDANKIVDALQGAVNDVRRAFSGDRVTVTGFKL